MKWMSQMQISPWSLPSEKAELEFENAPISTLPVKKLKETIRKSAKEKSSIAGVNP